MKFKKILSVLLIVIMCFTLISCGAVDDQNANPPTQSNSAQTSKVTPLLYKVTDGDGNAVWLFGSIHVGEDYFYPLPDYVLNALDNADNLAVEFDIVKFSNDLTAASTAISKFVMTDGKTVKDLVDEEVYNDAKKILVENGYYALPLECYLPILWMNFINEFSYKKIGADSELGIDKHLIERAYEKKIEVLDIESADFQYDMLANFSMDLQELLLRQAVESYNNIDEGKAELDKLMTLWANGDEKAFSEYLAEEGEFENEQEIRLYEEYNNAMLTERNKNMADWAEAALKSGKEVFICVGAAHVVGQGAMAEMLKNRGYKVELILK